MSHRRRDVPRFALARMPREQPTRRDPAVHSGDEVFTGARVPVATLVSLLMAGGTIEEFLEGYPSVERWQVKAVLERMGVSSDASGGLRGAPLSPGAPAEDAESAADQPRASRFEAGPLTPDEGLAATIALARLAAAIDEALSGEDLNAHPTLRALLEDSEKLAADLLHVESFDMVMRWLREAEGTGDPPVR